MIIGITGFYQQIFNYLLQKTARNPQFCKKKLTFVKLYRMPCANHKLIQELKMPDATDNKEEKQWYVLRVTYQREVAAKEKLDAIGVESFVPMQRTRKTTPAGRVVWKSVAALHNYIFVHSTRGKIDSVKADYIPWLRYTISPNRENGRCVMTVPEKQMQSFIAIAGNTDERILYLNPDEVNLTKGERVRIVGGVFEGAEGFFVKVENKREKRVVVKIDGITAVATTSLPRTLIEKIDK